MTVKEVSSFLNVHPKTVYKWTEERKIPFTKVNGLIRFKKKQIEDLNNHRDFSISEQTFLQSKFMIPLPEYDKMLLKGRSALSKKSKRWNYGFGTVYTRKTKQGKERWYIEFNSSGKRKRQVVAHAQSRAEAVLALQEKVAEVFSGKHQSAKKSRDCTFKELSTLYIDDYAKVNKKSWRDDMYRLNAHMEPFFGTAKIKDISPLMIEKYRAERLKNGITKSTVNRETTIMKRMFNLAMDWGLADSNPFLKVKLFSEKDTQKERILKMEEEAALLHECPEYLKPIVITALNTGMRRGEILNLKWAQVDLSERSIKVVGTKSGKNRILPVNAELHRVFMRMQKRNGKSPYVFPNPRTGKPYTEVKKSFKSACERAGIENLRFHDLRHTFASRLVESGVDLITVRDLLGHFSVRVTQRYTHSNRKQKMAAVEVLSQNQVKNGSDLSHICHISGNRETGEALNTSFSVN